MPFYSSEALQPLSDSANTLDTSQTDVDKERTSFVEATGAFFKLENPFYNAARNISSGASSVGSAYVNNLSERPETQFDPNFSPLTRLLDERPDLVHVAKEVASLPNEIAYERYIKNVDWRQEQQSIYANATGITKLSSALVASAADPINFLFGVSAVQKATRLGNMADFFIQGGIAGAKASATREAMLQATQDGRLAEESAYNFIAETVFGAALGSGIGVISNPGKAAAKHVFSKAMRGEDIQLEVKDGKVTAVPNRSVGAAEVNEFEQLGLAHINENFAKAVGGPEFLRSPELRAATSESTTVRKFGEKFYNTSLIRNKNLEGIATGYRVQTEISRMDRHVYSQLRSFDEAYLEYAGVGRLKASLGKVQDKISHKDFMARIWRQVVDADGPADEIAQVNKVAKQIRKDLDDTLAKLQEQGLLDDVDPDFAKNYLTRMYDRTKLNDPTIRQNFEEQLTARFRTHDRKGALREKPLEELEARQLAAKEIDAIRGDSDAQIATRGLIVSTRERKGFLKERGIVMDSELDLEPVLLTDAPRIYAMYMRNAHRLIASQKGIKDLGFDSFEDMLGQIRTEADTAVTLAKTPKQREKIAARFADQEQFLTDIYKSFLGTVRKPGNHITEHLSESLLNFQTMRLLGGVTVSSLPELAMPIFRHGFLNALKGGYVPMIGDARNFKASTDQLNELSGAMELEQGVLLQQMSDMLNGEDYGLSHNDIYGKAARGSRVGIQGFVKASGIGLYTGATRRLAVYQSLFVIRKLLNKAASKPLSKTETAQLASIGIGKDDYSRILKQLEEHGTTKGNTFFMNPEKWTDTEALRLINSAVEVNADAITLLPNVESLPLMAQKHPAFKLVFQFKSFMEAATTKIVISGLQRREAAVVEGAMAMMALGTVTQILKDRINGKESPEGPRLLAEGFSRTALGGLMGTTIFELGLMATGEHKHCF